MKSGMRYHARFAECCSRTAPARQHAQENFWETRPKFFLFDVDTLITPIPATLYIFVVRTARKPRSYSLRSKTSELSATPSNHHVDNACFEYVQPTSETSKRDSRPTVMSAHPSRFFGAHWCILVYNYTNTSERSAEDAQTINHPYRQPSPSP